MVNMVPIIFGWEPYTRLQGWLTILLNSLRMRFPWFPFHPVGYAISSSWSMNRLWVAMFLAWMIKALMLRYGGLRTYRQGLPFFLGLILGECIVGSLWTIIGITFNVPTYAFWP